MTRRERAVRAVRGFVVDARKQAVVVVAVFVLTWLLSRDDRLLGSRVTVPDSTASGLLLAIPQVLGAFLALVIAFLLFQMQHIEGERREGFREFQSHVQALLQHARELPASLEAFRKPIADTYDGIRGISLADLPLVGAEWERLHGPVMSFVDALDEIEDRLTFSDRAFAESLLAVFVGMERSLSNLGVTYIALITMKNTLDLAYRMIVLVIVSLVLGLLFGTVYVPGNLPDLNGPVVAAVLAWLILQMTELAWFLSLMYRDTQREWPLPV